jgi:hypothetical protein
LEEETMMVRWLICCAVFAGSLAGQALDVMFVLETSPGTEQTIGLIRPKDLKEADRAGVIGFVTAPQVIQPLTDDRERLATALRRAGIRITIGLGGGQGTPLNLPADLAGAIHLACRELDQGDGAVRKSAVLVFFTSEDPSLSARLDSLKLDLRAAKARLFAVVIQRVLPPQVPGRPDIHSYPFPTMTAQLLSELATASGGRVFKRNWDLKEILTEARKP